MYQVVIIAICVVVGMRGQDSVEPTSCTQPPVVNCNCGLNKDPTDLHIPPSTSLGIGRTGKAGVKGRKGMKGEPGTGEELLPQLRILNAKLEEVKKGLKWYTAPNGYQYRLTTNQQNWDESRRICQNMGADLAVVGMKDYDMRVKIARVLTHPRGIHHTWIGLTDVVQEQAWKWVDGSTVTDGNAHWDRGQPDNAEGNQDCGVLWPESKGFRTDDGRCHHISYAMCERLFPI